MGYKSSIVRKPRFHVPIATISEVRQKRKQETQMLLNEIRIENGKRKVTITITIE
jgi:hypothetical protein